MHFFPFGLQHPPHQRKHSPNRGEHAAAESLTRDHAYGARSLTQFSRALEMRCSPRENLKARECERRSGSKREYGGFVFRSIEQVFPGWSRMWKWSACGAMLRESSSQPAAAVPRSVRVRSVSRCGRERTRRVYAGCPTARGRPHFCPFKPERTLLLSL